MARTVRIRLNPDGMRALLQADGVRADLERRGRRVLAAARRSTADPAARDRLRLVSAGKSRARIYIIADAPTGMAIERKSGTLARSLDAARGD